MARKNSNGHGTIRKKRVKGKVYFEARYTDPVTHQQRSICSTTEAECSRRLLEIISKITTGNFVTPTKKTVGEWMTEWLSKKTINQCECVQELLVLLRLRSASEHQRLAAIVSNILHPPHVLFDIVVIGWMVDVHQVRVDVAVDHSAYAVRALVHALFVRDNYAEALYVHMHSLVLQSQDSCSSVSSAAFPTSTALTSFHFLLLSIEFM